MIIKKLKALFKFFFIKRALNYPSMLSDKLINFIWFLNLKIAFHLGSYDLHINDLVYKQSISPKYTFEWHSYVIW